MSKRSFGMAVKRRELAFALSIESCLEKIS